MGQPSKAEVQSGIGVVDKSVAILECVAAAPVALAGLVEVTGLPRATAHRLAVALEAHGLSTDAAKLKFDGLKDQAADIAKTVGQAAADSFRSSRGGNA